ncbi:MAG: hypothetical protein GX638_17900 [Crenarchaeota archaeon]|nr:hypothetical protein [Thermoproteota archaeon]
MEGKEVPNTQIRCPKCGSNDVIKNMNLEYKCNECGKIFFFVTPNTHSEKDLDRYKL